jgi:hypothetical protein
MQFGDQPGTGHDDSLFDRVTEQEKWPRSLGPPHALVGMISYGK